MGSLCITLHADGMPILFPLLQNGLAIRTDVGVSLEVFLVGFFDLSSGYINGRIQTILLDGKAVDNLSSTFIKNGSILALSAAMPGLAGATLRRGGHLATLRDGITYRSSGGKISPRPGDIIVKFFNVLIKELGVPLLDKGISVSGLALAGTLKSLAAQLPESCAGIVMDDGPISVVELLTDNVIQEMGKDEIWLLRITHLIA